MNIFEFLINLLQISLFVYFIWRALPIRKEKHLIMFFFLLIFVVITTLMNAFNIPSSVTVLFGLSYEVVFTIYFTKSHLGKKIFIGCLPMVISILAENITFTVLNTIFQDDYQALVFNTDIRNQALLIFILTDAILTLLIVRFTRHDFNYPRFFEIAIFLLCCMGCFASNVQLKYVLYFNKNEITISPISLSAVNYCFLINFLLILVLLEILGAFYKKNEVLQLQNNLYQLEEQELSNIKESSELLHSLKHDYKNQLSVLSTLLTKDQLPKAQAYIQEMLSNSNVIKPVFFTGNSVLDAILSVKYVIMTQNNIKLDYSIYIADTLPLSPMETSTLFGNLLDNAIEACQKVSSSRWIKLEIKPFECMLRITVSNASNGLYEWNEKKSLISTKHDNYHGYGLKQIRRVVEAVNGVQRIDPHEDYFVIDILIPLSILEETGKI